jgi:hypothetical protein
VKRVTITIEAELPDSATDGQIARVAESIGRHASESLGCLRQRTIYRLTSVKDPT